MKFPLHTIIMLCGPSGSGKDYFVDNYLLPQLKLRSQELNFPMNIQHVASDNIRRELIGMPDAHKLDDQVFRVSEQAFTLLFAKTRVLTQYPVNAHFVIVNTTGLDKTFRQNVLDVAKENNYNCAAILFDYRRGAYFKYAKTKIERAVTLKHLDRFKKEAIPDISNKKYNGGVYKIKSQEDMANVSVEITGVDEYRSYMLDPEKDYYVIGDVHGCLDELKLLLQKCNWLEEGRKTIFVGDLIDKGPQNNETIKFIHENLDRFIIVRGNHENYVYKRLKGVIDSAGEDLENDNFTSLNDFTEESKKLFLEVFAATKEFVVHPNFVVTHTPCERRYLAKLGEVAFRNQVRMTYPKRTSDMTDDQMIEELEKFLVHFKTEAQRAQPFHIFGHIPVSTMLRMENKLNIDTGCVHGGQLTAVRVRPGGKVDIQRVQALKEYKPQELVEIFSNYTRVDIEDLPYFDRSRIEESVKHKLMYVSGTMAPADKYNGDFESIFSALSYYKEAGIQKVVVQPKYMGSRAQIYVELDGLRSHLVTRNGHFRDDPKILAALNPYIGEKLFPYMKENKIKAILVDGELMPWSALGAGLIDERFRSIQQALSIDLAFAETNEFDRYFEELIAKRNADNWEINRTLSKEDMYNVYGNRQAKTYLLATAFLRSHRPNSEHLKAHDLYSKQVDQYAADAQISFKGFSILKTIHEDGHEETCFGKNNDDLFKLVNNDECLTIDLADDHAPQRALAFMDKVVKAGIEGIVIKPQQVTVPAWCVPYIKVRNPEYLRIIYGYDYLFPVKFERLLKQKSVEGKMRCSVREWNIGRRLLEVKREDIKPENKKYKHLLATMIVEENTVNKLDPRL